MQTTTNNLTTKQDNIAGYSKKFWPMIIGFYMLFFAREVFSIQFPVTVYLLWVVVMASLFSDTEIKGLIISFIPLAPGFQSKYAVLICMILLVIKYCMQLRIPLFVSLVPALMLWEFLHLGDSFSSIAEYLSGFAPFMCLAIVASLPKKDEDSSAFTRVLAVSSIVGSVILIANTVNGGGQSIFSLIENGFRLGLVEEVEEYIITYNANQLGYICNISIAGLLTNVYFKKAKVIDYLMMAFLIVMGCLTVSRTFLLCLVGTFGLYILIQNKTAAYKIKVFVVIFTIVLVGILALKMIAPGIIENYIMRFSADDITGGRSYLYDFYNEFITSTPGRLWFGIGVQSIAEKIGYLKNITVRNVPHNGYQQIIVAWGVIGLFLILLFVFGLALHAKKRNKQAPFMCYLPLILLLINITAGQFITSGTKLLSLVFVYLMICNGGKETVKRIR